jgi:uncharacterized membrane protein YhaH (DUF805 family)
MASPPAGLNLARWPGDQRQDAGETPMDALTFFFGFRGRINRAKYWLALLILCVVDVALGLVGLAVGKGVAFQTVNSAVNLAIFVSTLAVGVKRLHDRDRSAWWLLLFYVGPFLVALSGWLLLWATAGSSCDVRVLSLFMLRLCLMAGIALAIWGQVEIGFRRGTTGYNRFGADPLAKKPRPPRPLAGVAAQFAR